MKYNRIKYLAIFFVFPFLCFGQKHDYIWMLGYNSNATSEYPGVEGIKVDFNNLPPSFDYEVTKMNILSSNATISDSLANLLFYTNGCFIAGANHEVMENGDNLNPGEVHDIQCEYGYTAGTQSCLILPNPGNSSQYYLLHKHIVYEYDPQFDVISDVLNYTLVDMSLNEGQGSVIEKNVAIVEGPLNFGQLTAVKHANGNDWWVISAKKNESIYKIIEITSSGIFEREEQDIGLAATEGGQALFSPNGRYYFRYNSLDGVFVFNFDRQTGVLSEFNFLPVEGESVGSGVAVSPNSRYLYVSTKDTVIQFDLETGDILSSGKVVGIFDGFQSPFPATFHNAQLAPDCKIYINSFATVDVLHVIHNPDEPGLACNFEQHAIQLPFNEGRSLPHFPNYRLGPLVEGEDPPPPCEPVVSTKEEEPPSRQKAYVFPNPAPGYFKVVFEEALRRPGRVVLYNGLGQAVLEEVLGAGSREFRLEVGDVSPGLYFYSVLLEGELVKGGKLVVGRW
ncbi:MAG: hypothetical protein H6573_17550 [Lewinellaceae bacterium]|nr:hypothetical protein [Lewinellaceae bacterium]